MITLAIMAVLFIPMMRLFSHGLYSATISGEMITAVNLGRWEMEMVRNLNLTKEQLRTLGSLWIPELKEPPLEINNSRWRILRNVKTESNPLQVDVEVYLEGDLKKPVVILTTLLEDSIWVEGKRTYN